MKPYPDIKEDWETSKIRLTHWWAGEFYDRAIVLVTAPKKDIVRYLWPGGKVTPEIAYTDADYMIWRMEEDIRTTFYGGESLPIFWHNWSVGHALLLGCEPKFGLDTVWTDPLPSSEDGYPPIRFLREGRWWQWMLSVTLQAAQASRGRYYLMPAWGNHAADNLALIRGSQPLMLDILENPSWVKKAAQQVSDILIEVYTALWEQVDPRITGLEGSVNYCSLWSPFRTMGFDCDISCMLSPKQFEELFLPLLVETMRTVEHRIYHLDGTVALQHLDLLLGVPEIQAIQWVPGAGREAVLQRVPLIRHIQKAGKCVQVFADAGDIPALLNEVSARGLCVLTTCDSEQEAQDLMDVVARLSKD